MSSSKKTEVPPSDAGAADEQPPAGIPQSGKGEKKQLELNKERVQPLIPADGEEAQKLQAVKRPMSQTGKCTTMTTEGGPLSHAKKEAKE